MSLRLDLLANVSPRSMRARVFCTPCNGRGTIFTPTDSGSARIGSCPKCEGYGGTTVSIWRDYRLVAPPVMEVVDAVPPA